MTRARLKTPEHEVWQIAWGVSRAPRWVVACTIWQNEALYLVRRSGKQLIDPGDWLIRDLDGEPLWVPDKDFRRDYVVVEP